MSTTPFSPTTARTPFLHPKPLLSLPAGAGSSKVRLSVPRACLYGSLRVGFCSKHIVSRRGLVVTAATTEEITAHKTAVESDARARMEKTIEKVRTNFNTVRTGRSNPDMLDKIQLEYYGSPVGLKSMAQISCPDASSFLVTPYDKSSISAIEKAILSSNLGLSPSSDGTVIRLTVPQLTSDRRKEMLKVVAKLAEEGKVALRSIRRDALKTYDKLEKEKKLSEDNVKDLSSDFQKLLDEYIKKVEALYKQKEQELLKV